MAENAPIIEVRTSPHVRHTPSVDQIMRNVVYALLPVCAYAVYQFGISAFTLILVTVLACIGTEQLFCRLSNKPTTVGDFSAVISGMLLALTLPPGFPLWMAAVAGFVGISLAKVMFGGIGLNVFNPALVGRAFVQAAFPVAITTWTPAFAPGRFAEFIPSTWTFPFALPVAVDQWVKDIAVDGFTGATPLALQKFGDAAHAHVPTDAMALFMGNTAGSAGETWALLILVCGAYLAVRRMMDWRIPASMILGTYVTAWIFYKVDPSSYPTPEFMVLAGGLMLGAVFMASDMVASPVTPAGVWIYGILIGFLTVIIRLFGGLPEGVMYAILFGNAMSPLIGAWTQPRVYGTSRKKKA
jgi:electron transport complex protein RnfD